MATKKNTPAAEAAPVQEGMAEQANGAEERNPLVEALRKVLLAGIGAVALAQEEIEDFIDKLVERGEIAEKDGRKLAREVMEKRKKTTEKAEDQFNKRVEEILERMNVPAKSDIDALSDKITTLSQKVDELKKKQAE
jgi:poly(hydroxyalkanoate) granule-associated protein